MTISRPVFSVREARAPNGGTFVTGEQTDGAIGIFEGVIPPGHGVHWHTHTRETECFHVIEGRFRFWCGEDVREGGPGTTVAAPPHMRHRWENISDAPGRLLMSVTPGGFERFFAEVDALSPPTTEAIFELETRYGIISEILG
jgi:quercetin dioxygenase-like cupin family protein